MIQYGFQHLLSNDMNLDERFDKLKSMLTDKSFKYRFEKNYNGYSLSLRNCELIMHFQSNVKKIWLSVFIELENRSEFCITSFDEERLNKIFLHRFKDIQDIAMTYNWFVNYYYDKSTDARYNLL